MQYICSNSCVNLDPIQDVPECPVPQFDPLLLDNQICRSLYSASNALTRAYRPLLQPLGLTYPQYLVMLALWEQDRVSVGELCARTRLDPGTLTPLLKRMAGKGLLIRARARDDERRRVIALTRAGLELKARAADVPEQIACVAGLSLEEGLRLRELTEKLYRQLG
ncbi:MAG: MarR family transcriptional regulator [Gammaproteobacteria bacterium]|nr:MAG: MarR family transcriptional regulator [Gammaproteobacteria bacterium]